MNQFKKYINIRIVYKISKGSKTLTISAKAEMTLPNVVKDLLMLAPSFRRVPWAPVESARSLPAKSTKLILLTYK